MKSLVLRACVLILAFQSSSATDIEQLLKNLVGTNYEDDLEGCITEYNATRNDMYLERHIMAKLYTKYKHQERTRKNGCVMACFLKKQNLMKGSTIQETEIRALISKKFEGCFGEDIVLRIARKCLKIVRKMTEECDKSLSLYICGTRFLHKLQNLNEESEENAEIEDEEK